MSLYVGINNNRKEISNLFVGVNGVKREIAELYVGDKNGSKKLVFSNVNVDRDIQKTNPIKLLNSGKIKKEDIGKTVYLSNSNTTCQEWIIADVNHDAEDGSVDLVPKYVLGESISCGTRYYPRSDLRYWLNTTVLNGFANEILDGMVEIQYCTHKDSTSVMYHTDKIKCPNLTEMGISGTHISGESGYAYPLYGTATATNAKAIMRNASNTAVSYYTRGVIESGNYYNTMEIVTASGTRSSSSSGNAVIGFIRFRGNKELDIAKQLALTNPIDLLTSGKLDSTYIGRTVYISNPSSNCQEWLIAGVNHDNSGHYSIDLVSKYIMASSIAFAGYSDTNVYYYNSSLRHIIRNTFYNNFSKETTARMGIFTYTSNGVTAKDTVLAPTTAEVGLTSDSDEGTMYPLFGSDRVETNSNAIRSYNGKNMNYWTRDTQSTGNLACRVTSTGISQVVGFRDFTDSSSSTVSSKAGIAALIRFVKYDSNMSIDYQLDNMINPVEALTSGEITSGDIGKIVCLSNSVYNDIEWIIADINHDNTSDTIDLITKTPVLYNRSFRGYTSSSEAVSYNNSTINGYMNDIYNGFDYRIRSILTDMQFRCNNTTMSAKVKIPSLAELGLTAASEYASTDGQKYPIFTDSNSMVFRDIYGTNYDYWTRNTYIKSEINKYNNVALMSKYGSAIIDACNVNVDRVIRPIIRVKVK